VARALPASLFGADRPLERFNQIRFDPVRRRDDLTSSAVAGGFDCVTLFILFIYLFPFFVVLKETCTNIQSCAVEARNGKNNIRLCSFSFSSYLPVYFFLSAATARKRVVTALGQCEENTILPSFD